MNTQHLFPVQRVAISKEKLEYINEVDAMIKEMRIVYEKALPSTNKKKEIA